MPRDQRKDPSTDRPVRLTLQVRVILGWFAGHPGTAMTNGEIAQALDLGPGTVSEILARLVRAKLVDERADGRRTRYLLTGEGSDLARAHGLALVPTDRPLRMQNEPGS